MRIPAAIYPFSAEFLPAVKYFERLQDRYTLTKMCIRDSSYRNNKFRRVILAAFLTRRQPLHSVVAIPSMILLSVLNP